MNKKLLDNNFASILISVVFGLGLASVFRKICKNGRCIVVKGPPIDEIRKNVYKMDNECYKYTPFATNC